MAGASSLASWHIATVTTTIPLPIAIDVTIFELDLGNDSPCIVVISLLENKLVDNADVTVEQADGPLCMPINGVVKPPGVQEGVGPACIE